VTSPPTAAMLLEYSTPRFGSLARKRRSFTRGRSGKPWTHHTRRCWPAPRGFRRPSRRRQGSVALSFCPTLPPLYTRFTKRIGTSFFETTMRPNPRPSRARCCSPTRCEWPTLRIRRRAHWSRRLTSPRACSSSPGSTPGRAGLPRPPRCWRAPSRAATTATRGSGRRGCSTPRCPASPGTRRRGRRGHCHAPCVSSIREYPYRTDMRPVYVSFVIIRT